MGDSAGGGVHARHGGQRRPACPVHREGPPCLREGPGWVPSAAAPEGRHSMTCLTRRLARSTSSERRCPPGCQGRPPGPGGVAGCACRIPAQLPASPSVRPLRCPEPRMLCGFRAVPQMPAAPAARTAHVQAERPLPPQARARLSCPVQPLVAPGLGVRGGVSPAAAVVTRPLFSSGVSERDTCRCP